MAPTTSSIGYSGRGDYAMLPDGALRKRREHQVVPFVYAGAAIMSPALFADAPPRRVLATRMFDRANDQERLFGLRLDGVWMHVGTPRQSRPRKRRFWKASRKPSAALRSVIVVDRENGEARQPVFAHVVAGNMRQPDVQMASCGVPQDRAAGIAFWQRFGQGMPAPCAAEIKPIEMRDLAVGAVGDGGRPNSVTGSRCASWGRKRSNQGRNASGASRRRMHSASMSVDDWKSSPLGSPHAGQS